MKKTTKTSHFRKPFQLDDIIIHHNFPGLIDVYFLTLGSHKRQDRIIRQNGYRRIRESASDPLVELSLGFEYKWHCIYIKEEYIYSEEREKERRANIRKLPVLQSYSS